MGYNYCLLLEHLPWAQSLARAYAAKLPRHVDRDDLQSAGILGYIRAASRYDKSKGASFQGFCSVRIRGAMLDELRQWDWVPRSIHKHRKRITNVTRQLIEQLNREPTNSELAVALGIEPEELSSFQTHVQNRKLVSLDEICANGNGEENLSLIERLPDLHSRHPDEVILKAEDRHTLLQGINQLPKSEATIIVLHYLQNVPLRRIAAILAVSPARVSQLHAQALKHLRESTTIISAWS